MFRKLALLLVFVATLNGPAAVIAQQPVSVPLRNPEAAVVATYGQLSLMPMTQRRQLYAVLPAPMREDLWSLHLTYFLADHPELRAADRAVIFEALGLCQSGALETPESSSEWTARVSQPILQLAAHAKGAPGADILTSALTRLGGPDMPEVKSRQTLQTDDFGSMDCECNTTNSYCCIGPECWTSPTPNCRRPQRPFRCAASATGCGWVWSDPCNGICGL
jgi:hypothetical protein